MKTRILILPVVVLSAFFLPGCGGSGGGSQSRAGSLKLTVIWPVKSKLIPLASNSINATIKQSGIFIAGQLLPRPENGTQTTVTFTHVPIGTVSLNATAFPLANGSGVAQATGTVNAD